MHAHTHTHTHAHTHTHTHKHILTWPSFRVRGSMCEDGTQPLLTRIVSLDTNISIMIRIANTHTTLIQNQTTQHSLVSRQNNSNNETFVKPEHLTQKQSSARVQKLNLNTHVEISLWYDQDIMYSHTMIPSGYHVQSHYGPIRTSCTVTLWSHQDIT